MSTANEVKARVTQMIDRELARCAKAHGPAAWEKHREWVTEYVVSAAKQWLSQKALEGAL
jgi:hypothetical protein